MNLLQRYVLRELVGPFVMSVLVLTFLLLITQLFRLTEILINKGVPFAIFLQFLGALLPQILMLTLPMGFLVAVLLVFGRFSADREIMAMRTSGVNVFTLYWPVLIFGVLLTGVLFYFTNVLAPNKRLELTDLKSDVIYLLQNALEPGIWHEQDVTGDDAASIIFQSRGPNNTMENVQLYLLTSEGGGGVSANKEEVIILANQGWILPRPGGSAIGMRLRRGQFHQFDQFNPENYNLVRFGELERDIELEVDKVQKRGLEVEEMNSGLLRGYLADNITKPDLYFLGWTELIQRYSMPFAALAFVLLGMPLGVIGRTAGKSVGFTIAFGVIFLYYILLKFGASLGLEGSPLAGPIIFSPNIILAVAGIFLMWRTTRT